jgi:hypothetical protein
MLRATPEALIAENVAQQPGHVRHQPLHRRHEPARSSDPRLGGITPEPAGREGEIVIQNTMRLTLSIDTEWSMGQPVLSSYGNSRPSSKFR